MVQLFILDIADIQRDGAAVAVLLDREVVVQQGKLLIQGHQPFVAFGDAFQQAGQRRDHLGDAGGMLDGGHPLDAVQRIINKVGIDLVLQHAVFQILLLLFVLQAVVHQGGDAGRHAVNAPANVAQFVVPLNGRVKGKVAAADFGYAVLQCRDGRCDHAVQQKCQQQAQYQNSQKTDDQRIRQVGDLPLQRPVGDDLDQVQIVYTDGIPHHQLGIVSGCNGINLGAVIQHVHIQLLGRDIGQGLLGQDIAVDAVVPPAHLPQKAAALRHRKAFQRGRDQGRGDKGADVGLAAGAAQGQLAGKGDGVQRLRGQGHRVPHDTGPAGIFLVITGDAGQYLRRHGYGVGNGCTKNHLAAFGIDEHKPLYILHGAQCAVLGRYSGVHRKCLVVAADIR